MSDGPHRSLQMSRGWKRVAARGDNHAFAPEEVSAAIIPALEENCRTEIPEHFLDVIWGIFCHPEASLFETRVRPQLEQLRQNAGWGIGRSLIENALMVSDRGLGGIDGLVEALTNTLSDRAAKGARQVEEHYYRKAGTLRANRVRERIEDGIGRAPISGLVRRLLNLEPKPMPRLVHHCGLDDGVKF